MNKALGSIVVALLVSLGGNAAAQPVRVNVVVQISDVLTGDSSPVSHLYNPFTNGLGEIGFLGRLSNGDQFVFVTDEILWVDSDEITLDLGYSDYYSMGFSNAGGWIYAPEADDTANLDGIYSHNGIMLAQGDAAPGYADATIQALFRPIMLPGGAAYFVANIDTDADTNPEERALYLSPTAADDDLSIVMKSGDMVGGFALGEYGIHILYDVSDDGAHVATIVDLDTGASNNNIGVSVDGTLVMQEGQATGGGDNWGNFDLVAINNAGHYVVSGDTGGDASADDFIAYDGVIAIREGDLVDGVTLATSASVNGLSINNDNQVAFYWYNSAWEVLFFACDGSNIAGTARQLLAKGDFVDVDGDGFTDATVTDLHGSSSQGPALNLGSGNIVYVRVDLNYGAGDVEAIIGVPVTCCGNGVTDEGEDCDDDGESATCNIDCTTSSCGDEVVNATANEDCDHGVETATCDADCTVVECGDGTVNTAAGEVCDGSGESATCDIDCTAAECGDEVVNASADEDCDDGAQSLFCDGDCTLVECGDGTLNTGVGEECDDGGESATCDSDCSAPLCGDGLVNAAAGEECEDGNGVDGDGCSADCALEGGGGSDDDGDGGCGCTTGGESTARAPWVGLLLLLIGWVAIRRTSRTS